MSRAFFLVKELVVNVRPELQEYAAQATVAQCDRRATHRQAESAVWLRIVRIRDAAGGERPQYVGETECSAAGILASYKFLLQRASDATLDGAFTHAKVTRILLENYRVEEIAEEVTVETVGPGGSVALSVSGGALTVPGEFIFGLADARLGSRCHPRERVQGGLGHQAKLLPSSQRWSVLVVRHAEHRDHAQHALLLRFPQDFLRGLRTRLGWRRVRRVSLRC